MVSLVKPRKSELPKVDAAREGQQSADEMYHFIPQIKLEGPGKRGRMGTVMRRDLMMGENPWNGTRRVFDSSELKSCY